MDEQSTSSDPSRNGEPDKLPDSTAASKPELAPKVTLEDSGASPSDAASIASVPPKSPTSSSQPVEPYEVAESDAGSVLDPSNTSQANASQDNISQDNAQSTASKGKSRDKAGKKKKSVIELQSLDTPVPRGNMSMVTLTGQSLGSTPPNQGMVARGVVSPPFHRRPRFVLWLLLLLCLLLVSPMCLLDLGRVDITNPDEATALATLAETYARYQGAGPVKGLTLVEGLVPYLHGRPLDQPPALTWMQIAAIHLSFQPPNSPHEFILHGRVLSYVLALLTITCIFWAGHCIGGHRTALFAGVIAAVNPLLIHYARLATPTIALTALTMLAIASALWAIRPLRASPSVIRQGLGWATCGLAMSAAAFTIGLGAAPLIILPILLILLLCPNRISHLMGVIAAMLITALTIVSWIAFSQAYSLGVPWWWSAQAFTYFWLDQGWFDIGRLAWQTPLMILLAMLPWSLWLLGAIIQPFSSSSAGSRTRMFLSWAWFVLMFSLLLVLPTTTTGASLMVAMAAACVMIGQLFNQYIELANAGRYARFWRLLRWPHLLLIALASIALPLWLYFQPQLIDRLQLENVLLLTPARWFSVVLGIVLLSITAISVRWAVDNYPARALTAWTAWTLVLVMTLVTLWTRGPTIDQPIVKTGQDLHMKIGTTPVYWVSPVAPDARLTFYSQIYPAPISVTQLAEVRREQTQFYLIASADVPITAGKGMKMLTTLPGSKEGQSSMGLWHIKGQPIESSSPSSAAPEIKPRRPVVEQSPANDSSTTSPPAPTTTPASTPGATPFELPQTPQP